MKLKSFSLMASLLAGISMLLSADSTSEFEKLLENLEKQTFDFVQEKVYLHTDRPYYSLGDDLWFKAYTVAGPNHTPSPLSQNLHVELVNPDGRVLSHRVLFLDKGLGHGDFALADSLGAGNYLLRAYTSWMRNFDESYFFQKRFKLIDPEKAEATSTANVPEGDMRFFPEGGDLVQGLPSIVAVEWTGAEDNTQLEVVDQDGNGVARFTIEAEGLAKFSIMPLAGKEYFARTADGRKVALPKAKPAGLVMSVDNQSSETDVLIRVMSSDRNARQAAYLVAHTRGNVGFASKLDWQGAAVKVNIPKANLAAGITHLTLFNQSWLPEVERLIFKKPDPEVIQLSVATDKMIYAKRDSTTVRLKLKDQKGRPVKGYFSMNVYDTAQISPLAWKDNIMSSLLLTSDLRGEVRSPLQYLEDAPQARARLDLLLMTRGWSRFTWKDLLNDRFPEIEYEVERGFDVTGRVTQRSGKKGLAKANVQQVGVFQGVPLFAQATADGKGSFEMKNLLFYSGESTLKAKDRKGKDNVNLQLDSLGGLDWPDRVRLPAIYEKKKEVTETFVERSIERRRILKAYDTTGVTDLGSVVVEADEIDQDFENMQRGMVFGRGEYSVNVSDKMLRGQQFVNALFTVQGTVPGITVTLNGEGGEPNVQMTRKVESITNPDPPISYYIDDAPVTLAAVTSLPAARVERVEILKGMRATGLFGPSANGGAIMFYTKNREEQERFLTELQKRNIVLDKSVKGLQNGYYHGREFYAPNYSEAQLNEYRPDYRDLIHWAPMIVTDENGEATVTFYNADLPTRIRVQVEGLWEGGIPLVATTEYSVRD